MARVTVEDCAEVVPSRFELVAVAAQRARAIGSGGEVTVERNNDKDVVVALREIADGTIDVDNLRDVLVRSCQEKVSLDAYGVEDSEESDNKEIVEEIASMQPTESAASDEELLYGEDNMEDVDD